MNLKKLSKIKRLAAMGTAISVLAAGVSGCKPKEPTVEANKTEEVTPISMMSVFWSIGPITAENPIQKELEKRTNTKLDINWVSGNNYSEKLNVTLASGTIPDATLILDTINPIVRNMAKQGAFWDVGPYYKSYKTLAAQPAASWENTASGWPGAKMYSIPRVRPLLGNTQGNGLIRKDWLDKLNLKTPETMDDLYKVLQAFTNNDPDGNGQKDTVGMTGFVNPTDIGSFTHFVYTFNLSNGDWKVEKDGTLSHVWTSQYTKQALEWLRKAYAEGLIDKDVAVLKNTQADAVMTAGKAGFNTEPMSKSWTYDSALQKTNPKAQTVPLVALAGPNGKFVGESGGGYGGFVIPKTVTEAKMKKILGLFDYAQSDEGYELINFGFEGTHFTKDGELYKATEQAKTDAVGTFYNIFAKYDKYALASQAGAPKEYVDRNKKAIDEKEKIAIGMPNVGLVSETDAKVGPDLKKKFTETFLKVMLGAEPIEKWDEYVASLKNNTDYQNMIKEMNVAYKEKMANKK